MTHLTKRRKLRSLNCETKPKGVIIQMKALKECQVGVIIIKL